MMLRGDLILLDESIAVFAGMNRNILVLAIIYESI